MTNRLRKNERLGDGFGPGAPSAGIGSRRPRFARSADTDVDVVVIGGGVNGLGVARDAAMRGLRVALFERHDLAFGASGNSSGMIHGGPRYLSQDPEVTRSSCEDSGHIQRIAPHLLFRIPFVLPLPTAKRRLLPFYDGFFEAYDRYQPLKRGRPHVRLSAEELRTLEPGLTGDLCGGVSFDEWGIDGARLCVANATDAEERGARLHVGCSVDAIERDDSGAPRAVRWRDHHRTRSGRTTTVAVVNATGAWAPLTAALGDLPFESARVRPGKGIHVVTDRRLSNVAVLTDAIDGRSIFVEPWENMSIIGTTDDDYYGDLDAVVATSDEVRYLIQGVARVFPDVQHARLIGTFAGVRPTLFEYGPLEDALSRDHRIVDHSVHGADGLYSMIGGKLASYRLFAAEMVDVLAERFGLRQRCETHRAPLPGGDLPPIESILAESVGLDGIAVRRLAYRHGSRAVRIVERVRARPEEARVVCACEPVIEAEVRFVARHEHANTVADVSRRTRLGLGACGGMRCAARCGQILAEERRGSPQEGLRDGLRFLLRQARARSCALGPQQARQEALAIAAVRAQLGIDPRTTETGPGWTGDEEGAFG